MRKLMIERQRARRNLPIEERLRLSFADTDLEVLQEEAKERKVCGQGGVLLSKPVYGAKAEKGRTLEKIAKKAGCSHVTAHQYKKVMDTGQLDRLKKGESIKKVAGDIQREELREEQIEHLESIESKEEYR